MASNTELSGHGLESRLREKPPSYRCGSDDKGQVVDIPVVVYQKYLLEQNFRAIAFLSQPVQHTADEAVPPTPGTERPPVHGVAISPAVISTSKGLGVARLELTNARVDKRLSHDGSSG